MPRIFDNIEEKLLPALSAMLEVSDRSDFCVGYFRMRGWNSLAPFVENYKGGDDACCRVLVGMHRPPEVAMEEAQKIIRKDLYLDGPTVARLRRDAAESFKQQIEFGIPSNQSESALRTLARHIREHKVVVKLFLRYPLHAKLYLTHRQDPAAPLVAFLGSSNLTFSGLSHQGELNVDVVERDAADKLQRWFLDRWEDKFSFDISTELAELIETSWASEKLVLPYHVYLKIVYYLSEEARRGEREFKLPKVFQNVLLDFQERAVSLAAHYLHARGGVMLGDVVGLGKTLMAAAIARIFQEDDGSNTLVICPPKLEKMWRWYMCEYGITGDVLSLGRVTQDMVNLRPYRLVIIDESHNLRNRESKRYRHIREYLERCEPRVMLLSATPYNKHFTDLSNQLRLLVDENLDIHVRPEQFFKWWASQGKTEADFIAQYQTSPRSIRAFEQSEFDADWRDLMRLFLVRRTRQYIMEKYAKFDPDKQRYFVMLKGEPFYFPKRQPRTVEFTLDQDNPNDQYGSLYRDEIVDQIEHLFLPRYGLAHYLEEAKAKKATGPEKQVLDNLNRAGPRLRGFCRTGIFKRLESSGHCFLLSLQRHILRNMAAIHALENDLPLPIGTQDAALLDEAITDTDTDADPDENGGGAGGSNGASAVAPSLAAFKKRGADIYQEYRENQESRFSWLPVKFFKKDLKANLLADCEALFSILKKAGPWKPESDAKLALLQKLIAKTHAKDKLLVFTQFADTAEYLGRELAARGVQSLQVVSGNSDDPVSIARRFSPDSNGGLNVNDEEVRVLIATDVLAEGQNLQDAHIVVNYDLPWAIIRLVQRAGRVDRIGQKHHTISLYSFLPAEGVEAIIRLRSRLSLRLKQNGEVIGTDESFFGEEAASKLRDLYAEKSSAVEEDKDEDVDLASRAEQIWNSAPEEHRKVAENLPPVISATRPAPVESEGLPHPGGAITYLRFPDGSDALIHVDARGNFVSQSLCALFNAVACGPDTPALPRAENHHDLVGKAVEWATEEQNTMGGQLGTARNIRRKVYDRLKNYRQILKEQPTLFSKGILQRFEPAFNHIFRFHLREGARDSLSRQMKLGITDEGLADMVIKLHEEEKLCIVTDEIKEQEPRIVCSMGFALGSTSKKGGK